ncbi:LytTR family transcriptional regulator DNA-binding domain-containing protein [Paenibacillus sp. CAU 1782]
METLNISDGLIQKGGVNRLEVTQGACTVLLCNTDIGRSFIRSMLGEEKGDGVIFYRGKQVTLEGGQSAHKTGLSALDEGLYGRLKAKDYLSFWNGLYNVQTPVSEMLGLFGLEAKANERISKLSYSEKRLLGFARSILHDPELVIWEEPEQNLDLESCMTVRKIIDVLTERGKTLLITCSSMEQALSVSTRIFRFSDSAFSPIASLESVETQEEESRRADRKEKGYEAEAEQLKQEPDSEPELIEQPRTSPVLSRLMIKSEDKYLFIDPGHIHFIESNEGITQLYAEEGNYSCPWTLSELEAKLKPYRLYRCHRSYIVNLDCIAELIVWSRNSYSLVLNDEKRSRIPLSKGKFEELKSLISL